MAKETEKPRTTAECRKDYDALAKQVHDLNARRPKIRVEIEARVKAELGDIDKQIAEAMEKKRQASIALEAALKREEPDREARAAADAAKKAADETKKTAEANAKRKAENDATLKKRMAAAVAKQ